ncbi:MBOAT family protein [bacterium]|nr:MBOAT family protein [FCB group bacterium]MBL7190817.1 MBOAT family protein [bacterium]
MLFNSWEFLVFLPLVLFVYYSVNHKIQNRFLLLASYFFYGSWDWRFLSLLLISTIVDYVAGINIQKSNDPKIRKRFLWLSVCTNLGILGTFKYFNFFVDSFRDLISALGYTMPDTVILHVVLPVGISFYTFQTMSYTIDVYRKKLEPTREFFDFALFVAFFPQLVAGPIERASRLIPQLQMKRIVTTEMVQKGILLILIGYFKKVLIADNVAMYIDYVFGNFDHLGSGMLIEAIYLFAIQIYCDFAGYSDIAIGIGYLLGIKLSTNFKQPYLSTSITEFWRRWHITFSTWIRDYIYISLGGNRKGKIRTYINLFITAALGGLWHGAGWSFVIWGGLHGLYLTIERIFIFKGDRKVEPPPLTFKNSPLFIFRVLLTFHLNWICLVLFRTSSFGDAWRYFGRAFAFDDMGFFWIRPAFFTILLLMVDLPQYLSNSQTVFVKMPSLTRKIVYALVIIALLTLGNYREIPFVYFQF